MYGKKERKNADWFDANISELEPVINGKCTALVNYKRDPTRKNLKALRATWSKAQQTARRCPNNYSLQLSENTQNASDAPSEACVKASNRPLATKKTLITGQDKQMARLV